jgi:hypothetical protein
LPYSYQGRGVQASDWCHAVLQLPTIRLSGVTARNLPLVCGVETVTCTRSARKKGNVALTLTCCKCKLLDGEKPHPTNYRGCGHAKDQMRKRKSQTAPKTTTGCFFQPHHPRTILRGGATQQHKETAASVALSSQACNPSREAQPATSTKSVSSGS